MADSGSNSLESGSQNSSGSSGAEVARKKIKGPKVVKSRYMQFDKPKSTKNNAANTTILSAGKSQEKTGSASRKSMAPQRLKAPPVPTNVADGSFIFKDDLQSTLLDGHKIARPELDFSVINDKTMQKGTPKSMSEQKKPKRETPSASGGGGAPEDMTEMLESQTLIFTYLAMKMQKNMRRLEEKAERSLLQLHDEKAKLQEKVQQLKLEQLLTRREEQLDDLLEKQAESLAPPTAVTSQFKENYTSFANALDCTRHQLPIKDIHITGTRQRFLEDIQKHLDCTKSVLEEAMLGSADEDGDLLDTVKSLESVVHEMDAELSRSLCQLQELTYKVNKEIVLRNQKMIEDRNDLEVVQRWYFRPSSYSLD